MRLGSRFINSANIHVQRALYLSGPKPGSACGRGLIPAPGVYTFEPSREGAVACAGETAATRQRYKAQGWPRFFAAYPGDMSHHPSTLSGLRQGTTLSGRLSFPKIQSGQPGTKARIYMWARAEARAIIPFSARIILELYTLHGNDGSRQNSRIAM